MKYLSVSVTIHLLVVGLIWLKASQLAFLVRQDKYEPVLVEFVGSTAAARSPLMASSLDPFRELPAAEKKSEKKSELKRIKTTRKKKYAGNQKITSRKRPHRPQVSHSQMGAPLGANEPGNSKSLSKAERFLRAQSGRRQALTYTQQLKVYLEQNKVYPRAALKLRHSGTVKLRLKINRDGTFGKIEVIDPAPFKSLNRAAVDLIRKLGAFKPLPQTMNGEENFVIPIAYQLQGRI